MSQDNYTTSDTSFATTASPSPSAILNNYYYRSLSPEERKKYDFHHQLPGEPSHEVAVAILCLSATVLACSSLVLLATRYTSGGQSGTLVFLRSLLMSDILMALYGLTKMVILISLREMRVNFFLPDSLFFTASLASSSSLLSLNLDCFLKLARPFEYAQISKDRVISIMLLVWNAAFIVGFLPLAGWHEEAYTFRFFSFYPWHFLLFNGLVVFVCVIICIVCMVSLKKFYTLPETDPSCFSFRTLEIRKYRHLHRTIVIESAMWLAGYLPFFIYIALTCPQCVHGDYVNKDATILYFLPVFLGKSLFSAFLQAFRTFHVHTVMNKLITDFSNNQGHHSQPSYRQSTGTNNNDASVSTIAYTNPLCDHPEEHIYRTRGHDLPNLNHRNRHRHRRHSGYHHHPNCHRHPHHHLHHHHRYHDTYPFYPSRHEMDNDIDSILRQQEFAGRYLLDAADNWSLQPHHRRRHHYGHDLTDDDDDDDAIMMTTARLEIHGSDENIVGIANMGFRPSIDLHNTPNQQLSTKL